MLRLYGWAKYSDAAERTEPSPGSLWLPGVRVGGWEWGSVISGFEMYVQ